MTKNVYVYIGDPSVQASNSPVDCDALVTNVVTTPSSGYLYNRVTQGGDNAVAAATKWITLQNFIAAAGSDAAAAWATGNKKLMIWVGDIDNPKPPNPAGAYSVYTDFTNTKLTPMRNFFPGATEEGIPSLFITPPPLVSVPAIIALETASVVIGDDQNAGEALTDLLADAPFGTSQAPRLLWGLPAAPPAAGTDEVAGARFPQVITQIMIIPA